VLRRHRFGALETGSEIRLQVFERLDADRRTQQAIDESGGLTRHWIHRGVSHRRGMRDKGGAGRAPVTGKLVTEEGI
jgi:hypothetical protein